MLKCRVCSTVALNEHYAHSCVMPQSGSREEEPPERAVEASTSRGDVCSWKDETEVIRMTNGNLEMFTSSHWVGRILQIRPIEGRILLGKKSRRTWASGLLSSDTLRQIEKLANPEAATPTDSAIQPPTPPSEDGIQDDVNTPHASPPTTPSAIARRRSVSVKGIKIALAGLSLGSLSPFSKKKKKAAAAANPDPYTSPTAVSEPSADDLLLASAGEGDHKISFENNVKVCLCRNGRIELFINNHWQHPVTKIAYVGAYEDRTLVFSFGNRSITRTIDEHGYIEKLIKIMRICERAGINSDMRERMQDLQLDSIFEVPPPPIVVRNENEENNSEVCLLFLLISLYVLVIIKQTNKQILMSIVSDEIVQPSHQIESDVQIEDVSDTSRSTSPVPVTITDHTIWPAETAMIPSPISAEEEIQKPECLVCFSEEKNIVFFPCRHLCSCMECSKQLRDCPLCRKAILHRVQIFT